MTKRPGKNNGWVLSFSEYMPWKKLYKFKLTNTTMNNISEKTVVNRE